MMDAKLKEVERQRDNVEEALVTEREQGPAPATHELPPQVS